MLEKWEIRKEDVLEALKYKERCEKAIERLRGLQQLNNGFGASISSGALEDVIKLLDGRFDEMLKDSDN